MRTSVKHLPEHLDRFKRRLLAWAQQFEDAVWLDSNGHTLAYGSYDAILAVDAFTSITTNFFNAFSQLQDYQTATKDWIFGYLTYDLKNTTEALQSKNYDGVGFSDLYFFQPKKLFLIQGHTVEIRYLNAERAAITTDLQAIAAIDLTDPHNVPSPSITITPRICKEEYCAKVRKMLHYIKRGDIYEANFCQEFYAQDSVIDPLQTYNSLNNISKPPFATFLKTNDKYLLSASPERYLKKQGSKVISQPIKGTAKRSLNKASDMALKVGLSQDPKERSENIMIVDLVRNDLSHTATKGSVKVDELCKVYSFLQVHQMMSTISAKVLEETPPVKIIETTFPMGSMTGAPKISAMQIIEALETTKRGLYSGAVGYFTPDGDFDFNVIIRSILYNATKRYVSCSVGSAITAKSEPLKEYQECLLKAKAMRQVLEN